MPSLDHFLSRVPSHVTTLFLYSNGCPGQNKNANLMHYRFTLVSTGTSAITQAACPVSWCAGSLPPSLACGLGGDKLPARQGRGQAARTPGKGESCPHAREGGMLPAPHEMGQAACVIADYALSPSAGGGGEGGHWPPSCRRSCRRAGSCLNHLAPRWPQRGKRQCRHRPRSRRWWRPRWGHRRQASLPSLPKC